MAGAATSGAARTAGLAAFARNRKQDSRDRLMAAAVATFCADGYVAPSVEEIAAAAGVSRVTFYRHFSSKTALAVELFRDASAVAMPQFLEVRDTDPRNPKAVRFWIAELFSRDRLNRRLLRAFSQAAGVDPEFTTQAQQLIADIIAGLGERIPAFAVRPDHPAERRRWIEAWLLVYEILDQSNHAALESGVASDPVVIDILTARFVSFVA